MAENNLCRCLFCGLDKSVSRMKSFERGRKSMRVVGICEVCYRRLGVGFAVRSSA